MPRLRTADDVAESTLKGVYTQTSCNTPADVRARELQTRRLRVGQAPGLKFETLRRKYIMRQMATAGIDEDDVTARSTFSTTGFPDDHSARWLNSPV